MMKKIVRYILGFILLGLILAAFYFSKIMLFALSALFIFAAAAEYRQMFKSKEISIHPLLPELIGIFLSYNFIFSDNLSEHHLVMPVIICGVILSFIFTVLRNKKPYLITTFSTISAFLLILCGLYIIKLTYYYEKETSFYLVLIYFITVLSGDWIASKIGPLLKGKQLAKDISPDKTISGCISNLIVSCFVCLFLMKFLDFSFYQSLLTGIVISVFSQLGDLSVSCIKRDLGLKHSGNFFYDYGGILDRMDAFIFSAPALYYFLFVITII